MYGTDAIETFKNMDKVSVPFLQEWGILFDLGLYNVNLVNASCPYSYAVGCYNTPPQCGTACVNANTTPNHHKNIVYNLFNYNDINNWASYYDMLIILSGAQLCYNIDDIGHSVGVLGCAQVGAGSCIAENNTYQTIPTIRNVRTVQHELSHCFGCNDVEPNEVCDQDCIMSGGFDDDYNFGDDVCIWCDEHLAELNANQH